MFGKSPSPRTSYLETGVKVRFADGVGDFRYTVAGWSVEEDTLSVTLADIHYPFTVTLHCRVHEEFV